ncbi:hypothetical protein [Streptomyces antibioticus]|uniref:hypothetical protein n=1 Tax=Streptomyces antibioticus TaxID=1890 RepID=UPI0033E91947
MTTDPARLDDLFTRSVDGRQVQFVRPADTDRAEWGAYGQGRFLGMVHAEPGCDGPQWRVGATAERHRDLDDAVRALRRSSSSG